MKQRTRLPYKREKPRRKRPELFSKRKVEPVRVMEDGREICNMATRHGRNVYTDRILAMHERQKGLCCNCLKPLNFWEATFEHEFGRTGGRRDDRIKADGRRINGASHAICNTERGSKRTPIWHGEAA